MCVFVKTVVYKSVFNDIVENLEMGDDLLQFFAKKSAKVRDKKKRVKLSVDEVGQVLERKAKRQVSYWIISFAA